MHDGDDGRPPRPSHIRRRDRHGRGLRGVLAPPGVPLHRTRAEQFDDLILQAVARLEARWEAHLAGVEFAVEEIPPPPLPGELPDAIPLARLDTGSPGPAVGAHSGEPMTAQLPGDEEIAGRPPRIVVYRRPLMARADNDEELGELVFDVVVEEFARLLGIDPEDVDPGYGPDD